MKITIEKRKIAGNKQSLRLVYYHGHRTDEDGKVKHIRERERLDLFLYEKPKTAIERQHNKESMQLAEAIKAKRLVEYQSGRHDFKTAVRSDNSFLALFEKQIDKRKGLAKSTYDTWVSAFKQLQKFDGRKSLSVDDITPNYVAKFKDFLQNKAETRRGVKITKATAASYFNKFRAVVNDAAKKGFFATNPLNDISNIKSDTEKREYLEVSELRKLAATLCKDPLLKRAFLFSCLTGLRFSDIQKLSWSEIVTTDHGHRIVFTHQKTKGLQYLDLSDQAYSLLGEKKTDQVFYGLKYSSYTNTTLLRWCRDAGISKHITFHSGRHTFAVIQLTNGADIYTVSKLLGHSELKTTQIYADIIDARRKQAMNQMPDIGL